MKRTLIKNLLSSDDGNYDILIKGWVRTKRDYKDFTFIELNDGSSLKSIQIVLDKDLKSYEKLTEVTTGASLDISGKLVESKGKGQKWEILADTFEILGLADNTYPLQKKGHSLEFLREIAHLRPRSNLFSSIFRVRSRLSFAIHNFFQKRDFFYIHTPIITSSDCEGAGELFKVTTLDMNNIPKTDSQVDFKQDFFEKPAYLTVSGQLEGELFATALSNIYTFGPTFRAENSHTSRHASEFWMVEPEMAFYDIFDNMELAEIFIKDIIKDYLETSSDEINLFNRFVDKELKARLNHILEKDFEKIEYTKAIDILQKASEKFEYPVSYGVNLQTEHERYLTEQHFKKPLFVYNYPKEIKPFYMKLNDDGKTVRALDLLVPGIGEIIGGSQREEKLEVLQDNMKRLNLNEDDYWWYLDTRKFGSVYHSGFGLGFERLIMLLTGVSNIRDVIPFARTPQNIEF